MPDTAKGVRRVVIVGAGIQGCCTALELARLGHEVTLIDQDRLPMNRASLRNEGKIHLGLVYAADRSMATARLQLDGALRFWPLLRRWIGRDINDARLRLGLSSPFQYLVAKDSLLSPDQIEAHYRRLQADYRNRIDQAPDLDYLGARPERLYHRLNAGELSRHYDTAALAAGFSTTERSVSTDLLAAALREAVSQSRQIEFLGSHYVSRIEPCADGYRIEGTIVSRPYSFRANQVVNAAWEGRLVLDHQLGLEHSGFVHRLKYRAMVRLPNHTNTTDAPSVTMVLGRYGDVVMYPDGAVYLSWYPSAMRGWSHELQPPQAWQEPCTGKVAQEDFRRISRDMIEAIGRWYPAIRSAEPVLVDAGVIVAHGQTDVDDPGSGLHLRDRVGVRSIGGYHSLDAGKLTTAPMFAVEAAKRVDQHS